MMKGKLCNKSGETGVTAEPSWPELFRQGVQLHQKGIEGDAAAVQQAVDIFEQVRKAVPEDNLVMAYYGSSLCLLGRDLEDNVQRSAKVIQGLKYLDRAVRNEPDQFVIRMLRGHVCVNLPETYFHQNAKAVEDFQYLITCHESYPDDIPQELYFQFLYNLCIAYHNLGQTEAATAVRDRIQAEFKNASWRSGQNGEGIPVLLQPLPVLLEAAAEIHQRALTGEKRHIQQALDFFAQARLLHPEQTVFEAYHADCLSLQARNASNTGEMFANAIKATKTLDAAVVKEPDNIRIRLIRAQQSMRLPEVFFARTATAALDWEYLAERYLQEPELFEAGQIEEIRYQLGLCYRRLGLNEEAEAIWKDLLADTGPAMQARVTEQLQIQRTPEPFSGLSLATQRTQFYEEAKRLHNLGVAGNAAATRLALEMWEQAHTSDPADPVAQGYYGSTLALSGRDSNQVNEMFGKAIRGLKLIGEALDRDPENWELHLLRGYLAYSLPEVFFHTTSQAIEDFKFLKQAYERDNSLFPAELYTRIVADLEKAARRVGIPLESNQSR